MSKKNKSKNKSKKKVKQKKQYNKSVIEEIILFVSVGFSLLLTYTFFAENNGGFLGLLLNNFFIGLFGTGAYIAPIIIVGITVYYFLNAKNMKNVKKITLLTLATYLVTLVLLHTITKNLIDLQSFSDYFNYNIVKTTTKIVNGGLMGALIGNAFITVVGSFGTYIFIIICYATLFILYTNKSLAKILATFGVNTTKFGINKTKEASNKISKYTENIKQQREERNKERELEKELEKELELARKESSEKIKFTKPIPSKQLKENYKKVPPKSVANAFMKKNFKEKNVKVPKKPSLFIIKERQEKINNISLAKNSIGKKEDKIYDTTPITENVEQEYFSTKKEDVILNDNNTQPSGIYNMPSNDNVQTNEIYDTPSSKFSKQQEKVNEFYEEVKDNFSKPSNFQNTNPYISVKNDIYIEDVEDVSDDELIHTSQSFINDKYDDLVVETNNAYIHESDNNEYDFNDVTEKINSAVVEDNIIHGLFDYVEDNNTTALQDDVDEYNNLFDDKFDVIDDFEEESKAFDEINENLKSKSNTNRFLQKPQPPTEEPVMSYDAKDKNKLSLDNYEFPPIDFLSPKQKTNNSLSDIEIQENSLKLEETLKSFGVKATVVNVSRGPTVTRYEIEPGIGVKVSKIANLVDDLALSLASSGIRIQAPIPNKPYVGIEVPNKVTESVLLREVIDSDTFRNFKSKLAFGIGKDIGGDSVIFDIGKMPHVLVAGATGSGKSVCVNTLISSIIYKARPDEVKLLMIDPKVVELSVYNGIPHLLIPVVTDPKKANSALNWAVREMERRYGLFADNYVRNLDGYNQVAKEKNYDEILPRIVVIIDELADLMMTAAKEVEDSICRLAQKARAAGIHLIIATQRPSVDVITGLIKANIPTRMAFAVSSGIDSRTILDTVGAERLLGRGDMLFLPYGSNEPTRVQGAFISDKEVENIVEYLSQYKAPKFSDEVIEKITSNNTTNASDDDVDELFPQIVDFILEKQKASASMLQSKFRIGFNRASRVIEQLEERQFIGPTEGSKARKVIITKAEWEEIRESY